MRGIEDLVGIEARKGSMHPPLTGIPIGAVAIGAVLHAISAGHRLGSSTGHDAHRAATPTRMVGDQLVHGAGVRDGQLTKRHV